LKILRGNTGIEWREKKEWKKIIGVKLEGRLEHSLLHHGGKTETIQILLQKMVFGDKIVSHALP
jgi:hypothetical protein